MAELSYRNLQEELRALPDLVASCLGLRLLPIGFWFVANAAVHAGLLPYWWRWVLLAFAVGATVLIHDQLSQSFGQVETGTVNSHRNVVLFAGLLACYFVLQQVEEGRGVFSILALTTATLVVMTVLAFFSASARLPSSLLLLLVISVAIVVVALIENDSGWHRNWGPTLTSFLFGALLIVIGVLDSVALKRALTRIRSRTRLETTEGRGLER